MKAFLITFNFSRTNLDPLIISGSVTILAPNKDAAVAHCIQKGYVPSFINGGDLEVWEPSK